MFSTNGTATLKGKVRTKTRGSNPQQLYWQYHPDTVKSPYNTNTYFIDSSVPNT